MATADDTERWLPVVGWEGLYEVSDHGRVRSLPWTKIRSNGAMFTLRGRVLKASPSSSGYPRVTLHKNGRMTYKHVHTLVMASFVGPQPENTDVCHSDGNPTNNRLSNLRFDTRVGNMRDAITQGRTFPLRTGLCRNQLHEMTPKNTRIVHRKRGDERQCIACKAAARRRERKRS